MKFTKPFIRPFRPLSARVKAIFLSVAAAAGLAAGIYFAALAPGRPSGERQAEGARALPAVSSAQDEAGKPYYPDNDEKSVYLTFDDGPSEVTPLILDTLKEHGVSATFFVIGQEIYKYPRVLRREVEEGHAVANHTYSHDYGRIYASSEALLRDIEKSNQAIEEVLETRYPISIFRFPSGSGDKRKSLKLAVNEAGYRFVDWNCSSGDAIRTYVDAPEIMRNIRATFLNRNTEVVLFHDNHTKRETAMALPGVIKFFKEKGYTFKTF